MWAESIGNTFVGISGIRLSNGSVPADLFQGMSAGRRQLGRLLA
jgi:hypothetical protein